MQEATVNMIKKYLYSDEQILIEVPVQYSVTTVGLWGSATDYIFYATDKRLLCYHISHNHIPDQIYELPYSGIAISLKEIIRVRWYLALIGIVIILLFYLDPLFWYLGLLLIVAGFIPFKDAWYQIDSPSMTESKRRIWQIPKYAQNADKFYAVVSEKVGRSG